MPINDANQAALLAKLEERYRPAHPDDRLLLLVDRRADSRTTVIAISPSSPWHELLPEAQVVEITDRERDER